MLTWSAGKAFKTPFAATNHLAIYEFFEDVRDQLVSFHLPEEVSGYGKQDPNSVESVRDHLRNILLDYILKELQSQAHGTEGPSSYDFGYTALLCGLFQDLLEIYRFFVPLDCLYEMSRNFWGAIGTFIVVINHS